LKKYKEYLVYVLIIIGFLTVYARVHYYLERGFIRLNARLYHYFILYGLQVLLGIMIGLEKFIEEYRKEGKWKVNTSRILIMGTPTLLLSSQAIMLVLPYSIRLTYFII